MSRLEVAMTRYAFSSRLISGGVERDIVVDALGTRYNKALWQVVVMRGTDTNGLWEDLIRPAKALRWRLLTQPGPASQAADVKQAAVEVVARSRRLSPTVDGNTRLLLNELASAAEAVSTSDAPVGDTLLESAAEADSRTCVVIAATGAAADALNTWLGPLGFCVRTPAELQRACVFYENGYAVGPPRIFHSSVISAPLTEMLNFIFPSWYRDREFPTSPMSSQAEGAIKIRGRNFFVGCETQLVTVDPEICQREEEALLPGIAWLPPTSAQQRPPGPEEVSARAVYLSGDYQIWLDDDGDKIRAVDLSRPGNPYVANLDIDEVRAGVFLLLRDGDTEREALYKATLRLLGGQAKVVEDSQAAWKALLQERLDRLGRPRVNQELSAVGVRAVDQVVAWTDPLLARPLNNRDFQALLSWLGLPLQPTYDLATLVRQFRSKASHQIGQFLQAAVANADTARLERQGQLRLQVDAEGFRGVIAIRVLGISPFTHTVARSQARVLREDRGAKWCE